MEVIHKAGAFIFKDKKMLIVKPSGKPFYITPGGKYEVGETAEDCLQRELLEELNVKLLSFTHYKTYDIEKAAHADLPLLLELYIVTIEGEAKSSSEIETLAWFSQEDFYNKKYNIPSSFSLFVPDLIKDGLL